MLISGVNNLKYLLITKKKSETVRASDLYNISKELTP